VTVAGRPQLRQLPGLTVLQPIVISWLGAGNWKKAADAVLMSVMWSSVSWGYAEVFFQCSVV